MTRIIVTSQALNAVDCNITQFVFTRRCSYETVSFKKNNDSLLKYSQSNVHYKHFNITSDIESPGRCV